jgi:hypothetical protein
VKRVRFQENAPWSARRVKQRPDTVVAHAFHEQVGDPERVKQVGRGGARVALDPRRGEEFLNVGVLRGSVTLARSLKLTHGSK